MNIIQNGTQFTLYKEKDCIGRAELSQNRVATLEIVPRWRRRGYGRYLLKELPRRGGGFDLAVESTFTAPLPAADNAAAWSLAVRFGFTAHGGPRLSPILISELTRLRRTSYTVFRLTYKTLHIY